MGEGTGVRVGVGKGMSDTIGIQFITALPTPTPTHPLKFNIDQVLTNVNHHTLRHKVINTSIQEKQIIDHGRTMFIHFTYCSSMRVFPKKFRLLWNKYFGESPLSEIRPVLGTRNVNNLQRRLGHTRQS